MLRKEIVIGTKIKSVTDTNMRDHNWYQDKRL